MATNNSLYTYEIFNYFFITTNICRIFLCPNINAEVSKYQPLKLRSLLLALQLDRYTCKHNMHTICNAFFLFGHWDISTDRNTSLEGLFPFSILKTRSDHPLFRGVLQQPCCIKLYFTCFESLLLCGISILSTYCPLKQPDSIFKIIHSFVCYAENTKPVFFLSIYPPFIGIYSTYIKRQLAHALIALLQFLHKSILLL